MERLRRRRKRKRKISYAKIKRQHTSRLIKKLIKHQTMNEEIKIRKYYIMETELGPHSKEYTTYRRNNEENWEVLMGLKFVQLGRRSERQLENLFQNYWLNKNKNE